MGEERSEGSRVRVGGVGVQVRIYIGAVCSTDTVLVYVTLQPTRTQCKALFLRVVVVICVQTAPVVQYVCVTFLTTFGTLCTV